MLSYCLKCKKSTQINDAVNLKTSTGGTIILSKFAVCNTKNQDLLKNSIIR